MLFRLVRPMRRAGSSIPQFKKRIPKDVCERAKGRRLDIPLGAATVQLTISPHADTVRFSLQTHDPAEAKKRNAVAAVYLETVWQALRETKPVALTQRQAVALAGELYRAWAEGEQRGESTIAILHTPNGWVRDNVTPAENAALFKAAGALLEAIASEVSPARLERTLGPLVNRLLLAKGIASVDAETRQMLLDAFHDALRDAMAARERNASGDYTPDPRAQRFPAWEAPSEQGRSAKASRTKTSASLKGLVEDWWREAEAGGRKPSTHQSYASTMAKFVAFLRHDDASRVTPQDVVAFKDDRLTTIDPRSHKPISPKTVKDSDLAGLKTIFGWAVVNLRMDTNPAAGVTLSRGKVRRLRVTKGFTDGEASAILSAAASLKPSGERPRTFAAKRWVPWLMAYSGARVGEMAQLRKEDVRHEGEHWVVTVTPEAGTQKSNQARQVVLHPHIIERGFATFVASAPEGHLFLKPSKSGDVLGPLKGLKNRLQVFTRAIVSDRNVQPTHGWRHRFKTVGMQAGIETRILDAIQGHSAKNASGGYGEVTVITQAAAIAKLPRIIVAAPGDVT
jgi:integrase